MVNIEQKVIKLKMVVMMMRMGRMLFGSKIFRNQRIININLLIDQFWWLLGSLNGSTPKTLLHANNNLFVFIWLNNVIIDVQPKKLHFIFKIFFSSQR